MKKLILNLIKYYQRYLSLERKGIKVCRFEPSCSAYAYEAVHKFGVIKGGFFSVLRVLKCNPIFKGGYDPVLK